MATDWNANRQAHAHLNAGPFARSTLAEASMRWPAAIFAETFTFLSAQADRGLRREGGDVIRILDSSPIPLPVMMGWRTSNGCIKGMKLHVVFDRRSDHPRRIDLTPAGLNDVDYGREIVLEPGARYVFDKGYRDYAWWRRIHDAAATFVTRKKTNTPYRRVTERPCDAADGDGFRVVADADVEHAPKSRDGKRLAVPMREIRVRRDTGDVLTLLTNDRTRPAVEIAALYKERWQIELLFRWIKQNLKIATFVGRSANAVRIQVLCAMIAYILLRLAARRHRLTQPAIRLLDSSAPDCSSRRL